jgi:bile acid:Na+ symporter, BASS family
MLGAVKMLIGVVVPAMTFLLLVAVGLDLTANDFARVRRHPLLILTGLFAPLVLLPPIAFALTLVFETGPDVTAGALLVAACPIGGISNTYSYLARASPALSVMLTGLSCLCASVTIPLVGRGLDLATGRPLALTAPIPLLIGQGVLLLGLPVAIGIWVRRRSPGFAERHRTTLTRLAFAGTGIVLVLVIANDPDAFLRGLSTTVPLAAVFVMSSVGIGWITAALVTKDRKDRFTIAAEFGTRNVSVAVAIAVTVLGRVEFASFATTYFLTEVPLMLLAVAAFRIYGPWAWRTSDT